MADRKSYNHGNGGSGGSFSSDDFERLCKNIDNTVSQMSDLIGRTIGKNGQNLGETIGQAVGEGLKNASDAAKNAMKGGKGANENYAPPSGSPYIVPKSSSQLVRKQFRSPSGLTLSGAAMAAGGGFLTFSFGLSAIVSLVAPAAVFTGAELELTGAMITATGVSCLIFTGLSAWLLGAGISRISLSGKYKSIKRIMCGRDVCSFNELSSQMHLPKKKVVAICRKLIRRGLIPEGHIDDEETCLMTSNEAYALYRQAQREYLRRVKMEREKESSRIAEENRKARDAEELASKLPKEALDFLREGNTYLDKIAQLDVDIDDAAVSEKIVQIEEVVSRIFARVKEEPAVLGILSNMTGYYLPTTVKLLQAYDELEDQPVQVSSVTDSRKEIEHTLDVLYDAFEKLLDETFRDMTMDVSSDITVLHAVLAQDGLGQSPFDAPTKTDNP